MTMMMGGGGGEKERGKEDMNERRKPVKVCRR